MSMEAALRTFFIEAREMLEQKESLLLKFENNEIEDENDSLNAIFRAAHTIKGSAGIFNLDEIVAFTHVVENVLDKLREHKLTLDDELISLLLQCCDHLGRLLDVAEMYTQGKEEPDAMEEYAEHQALLLSQLNQYWHETAKAEVGAAHSEAQDTSSHPPDKPPSAVSMERSGHFERFVSEVGHDDWHILVLFGENTFRDGMDPASFIQFLEKKGEVKDIWPLIDRFCDLELTAYDPESCYLGFEIRFSSTASKQEIEDVFEFMREEGSLHLIPPNSVLRDYLEIIDLMPETDLRLGEILIECGALTKLELEKALQRQTSAENKLPLGEILLENKACPGEVLEAALQKQNTVRSNVTREQKTLRIDADKLDTLINYVGELVTAGAGTVLRAETLGDSQMLESVMLLNNLLEDVRDVALKLRMVPIGETFSKFKRVVRDTAKELGKEVELVIKGADTELDKTVVEKIGDPLMHLVRNALDHGIETAETRRSKGKVAKGTLLLNAYHDSGNIVIEVRDDGKGLDPEVIRKKAIEKGLISEDAQLNQHELFNLIFEPGFSTAASVTNISGRGVGMDVVRRNITELRGRIDIDSELGKGSTLKITLPLTLAIIDGFLVEVAGDAFVIPLNQIQECVEFLNTTHSDREESYVSLRGEVLPIINLRQHFELKNPPSKRQSLVVVRAGELRGGLVVDRLLGEFQTVIKPLGKVFEHLDGLSGSTIMGSGNVALILDIQGLIKQFSRQATTELPVKQTF